MTDSGIMDHQHDGNLLADSAGHGTARMAELGGLLLMAAQHAARVRDQRLQAELASDEQAATAVRAQLRTDHAADRLRWAPALERDFASSATATEALGTWTAAQPWVDHDPTAAEASKRAEDRLTVLQPDLMEQYRSNRAAGAAPTDAMLAAGHDVSARDWQDVLDPATRQGMGVDDTLRSWNAARPWAAPDAFGSPEAAQAMTAAEGQLRTLRPVAMASYDEARAMGVDPLEAMQSVAPQLREQVWDADRVENAPLDPGAAQAARTLAVEERGDAQRDFATLDQPSTANVDEHAVGLHQGAVHEEVFENSAARAATLAGQSYPHSVHVALASRSAAPAAAPSTQVAQVAQVQQSPGRRR